MSPPISNANLAYRVSELEADVRSLSKKVDRMTWALVTLTMTLAGSAIVFALTVASIGGRSP